MTYGLMELSEGGAACLRMERWPRDSSTLTIRNLGKYATEKNYRDNGDGKWIVWFTERDG